MTNEQAIEALKLAGGSMKLAAKRNGISYAQMYNIVRNNPDVKDHVVKGTGGVVKGTVLGPRKPVRRTLPKVVKEPVRAQPKDVAMLALAEILGILGRLDELTRKRVTEAVVDIL